MVGLFKQTHMRIDMMKLKLSTVAVATALTLGATASLAETDYQAFSMPLDSNYLHLGAGYGHLNNIAQYLATDGYKSTDTSDGSYSSQFIKNVGYNISVGHLWSTDPTSALGVEIGFYQYPKTSIEKVGPTTDDKTTTEKVEDQARNVNMSLVSRYNFNSDFGIQVKAGLAYLMSNRHYNTYETSDGTTTEVPNSKADMSNEKFVYTVTGGMVYKLTDKLDLNIDATFTPARGLNLKEPEAPKSDVDAKSIEKENLVFSTLAITAGLTYNF